MKRIALILAILAAALAGATAQAATGWHVFASSVDKGDYGAYVSASASVSKPHALAVRVTKAADVTWTLSCDGATHARAGQVIVATVASAGSCRLSTAGNSSTAGTLKIELLKR